MPFDTLKLVGNATKPPAESEAPLLHELVKPHLQSFNSIFEDHLLDAAIRNLEPVELVDNNGNKLRYWIEELQVAKPMLHERECRSVNRALLPTEVRKKIIFLFLVPTKRNYIQSENDSKVVVSN